MFKFSIALSFTLFCYHLIYAQIAPEEGSKLNYRLIGVKFPPASDAHDYNIELAAGNFTNEDSFKRNLILTLPVENNRIIIEVPAFGALYTWRYNYTVKGASIHSTLHHFSTTSIEQVDTNFIRLRVIQPALKHKGDYVFLDGNGALYDMAGNPVWYLPNIPWAMNFRNLLSDLKCSPQNTITYILKYKKNENPAITNNDFMAYEVNYDGKVLWKAPNNGKVSGDSIEHYHHEFSRLNSGHYMVLGSETNWSLPGLNNNNTPKNLNDGMKYEPIEFGTVIEYDKSGNVVWSWKSSKYFLEIDTTFIKPTKKYGPAIDYTNRYKIDYVHPDVENLQQDVHLNAFFFDEKNKVIYLSFKNVSKIIKLKYPEGTVLNAYGPVQKKNGDETGINLFCHQHGCRLSDDGYLYLFNNNLCDTTPAKIEMFQEPGAQNGALKKIWEYQCTVEGNYPKKFPSGGNVYELPDSSLFVNMSSDFSKIFIVSPDKRILWTAIPEKWYANINKWKILHQYRASIISRSQLENLIWNSETKE